MQEPLRSISEDEYLGDVRAVEIGELRKRRTVCQHTETGLSYLRRLVQGRLDILGAERARRAEGGGDDLEGLIARLPDLLAGSTRSPGNGRLPAELGTGDVDADLAAELDRLVVEHHLSDPSPLDEAALQAAVDELEAFERQVSDLRRTLFDRIDAIQAELTRRYRTGEATVDGLLHGAADGT